MTSLALMMFSWNDPEGILSNVECLRNYVDEIVIIDSSDSTTFARLNSALRPYDARTYRFLPIGTVDLARGYALKKVRSDYVFYIDADERATPQLLRILRSLTDSDAYVVPRLEVALHAFTDQIRLYRRDSVFYSGFLHNTPEVDGATTHLEGEFAIKHYANHAGFFSGGEQRGVQLQSVIDSYQRIYTGRRVSRANRFRPLNRLMPPTAALLPPSVASAIMGLDYASSILNGVHPYLAKTNLIYARARYAFTRKLDPAERARRFAIAEEIWNARGPIPYLCLDDVDYVEHLLSTFRWNLEPLKIYERLLDYRHKNGRCASSLN